MNENSSLSQFPRRKKLEKGTVQSTIHSTGEPQLLAEAELHPILCPDATTATCTPHILSAHPAPGRLLVEEVEGSIEGGGGGGVKCPPTLKIVSVVCACVSLCVSEWSVMCVCVYMRAYVCLWFDSVCMCVCVCASEWSVCEWSVYVMCVYNCTFVRVEVWCACVCVGGSMGGNDRHILPTLA